MLGVSPDSTNEDGLTALHQVRFIDAQFRHLYVGILFAWFDSTANMRSLWVIGNIYSCRLSQLLFAVCLSFLLLMDRHTRPELGSFPNSTVLFTCFSCWVLTIWQTLTIKWTSINWFITLFILFLLFTFELCILLIRKWTSRFHVLLAFSLISFNAEHVYSYMLAQSLFGSINEELHFVHTI